MVDLDNYALCRNRKRCAVLILASKQCVVGECGVVFYSNKACFTFEKIVVVEHCFV